jgi:glycine/D-amino acid oxidase-like deaminating enzyme
MRVLIIGQGIAGTWLSYRFAQKGAEVIVIDKEHPDSSTRVASGVINPVTGRQVVTTWRADELLPFSEKQYARIGKEVGSEVVKNCGILAFPPSDQMMDAYAQKMAEGSPYVHMVAEADTYEEYFHFLYGAVHIKPAYWIDLQTLLAGWRKKLVENNNLINEFFDENHLEVHSDYVNYKEIRADYVFYCIGMKAAQSAYWSGLPFSFNKGEALIVDIPGLPHGQIYKFGISTLVPWHDGTWWVGSTYDNRYSDENPTAAFRQKMELFLQQTVKMPFTVISQIAAIRPATVERRPFAGLHPVHTRVGILGGLGTKGVSLAPWLAKQLVENVYDGKPIEPAADIARFRRAFH